MIRAAGEKERKKERKTMIECDIDDSFPKEFQLLFLSRNSDDNDDNDDNNDDVSAPSFFKIFFTFIQFWDNS